MAVHRAETAKLAEIASLQTARNFERGMKLTRQILNKNSSCAEAVAWKAYFTHAQDNAKTTEAIAIMKEANRLDLRNSKVWRTGGLMYREMGDFARSLQCLKQSHTCDPSDMMVLNDVCTLNVFFANYRQLVKDCRVIMRQNVTGYTIVRYAYALTLNGDHTFADGVLANFQASWRDDGAEQDYQFRSEVCLLRMKLLVAIGKYQECLEYAEKNAEIIKDAELSRELQVECLQKLEKDPMPVLMELLKMYPENGDYFNVVEAVTPADVLIDKLIELSKILKSHYAHVRALEIMDVSDSRFRTMLAAHLEPLLIKGSPGAFMTIRELNSAKLDIAVEIARAVTTPIAYVPIVHLFVAHVHGYTGDYDRAFAEIDTGLKHTATCVELIACKALFMARAGRVSEAVIAGDQLSAADPTDRKANTLTVKCLFLGGYRQRATELAQSFAGSDGGKELIFNTQFNVFYLQNALSSLRAGDVESAKRLYNGILSHYTMYKQDQFHYVGCVWRMPRTMIDMIEEMNTFEKCPIFGKAVEFLMQIALLEGNICDMKDLAMRAMKCEQPGALAYACVVFGHLKMRLQALKCYLLVTETQFAFLARPTMQLLALSDNATVQSVITELYIPVSRTPTSFADFYCLGLGEMSVGHCEEATSAFLQAIGAETVSFKRALQLYVYATALSGHEGLKSQIVTALVAKYPSFEFNPACTSRYAAAM